MKAGSKEILPKSPIDNNTTLLKPRAVSHAGEKDRLRQSKLQTRKPMR